MTELRNWPADAVERRCVAALVPYPFAGKYRTVRIAKGASMFCYPEHITSEMRRLLRQDGMPTTCRAVHFAGMTHA